MADNDVLVTFTGDDSGLSDTAASADKKLEQTSKGTAQANEHLAKSHLSVRHAMGLLASQSGMSTSSLMHFYYAIMMVPGPLGIALGAVMALKHGIESYTEAQQKALEEQTKFYEGLEKYREYSGAAKLTGSGGAGAELIKQANTERYAMIQKEHELGDSIIAQLGFHKEELKTLHEEASVLDAMILKLQNRATLENLITAAATKTADAYFKTQMGMNATTNPGDDKRKSRDAAWANAQIVAEEAKSAMNRLAPGTAGYEEHKKKYQKAALEENKLANEAQAATFKSFADHAQRMGGPQASYTDNPYDKLESMAESYRMKAETAEASLQKRLREIDENEWLTAEQKREEYDQAHHENAVAQANETTKYEMEKAQEVTNRKRTMIDIAHQTIGFQVGGGMGGYLDKLEGMRRKVEDARRDRKESEAQALEGKNQAELERMAKDVDRQLRHATPMSFESGGDFYKSFSTRINNADPEKHEQLAVLRTIRDLLSHNRVASLEKQHAEVS